MLHEAVEALKSLAKRPGFVLLVCLPLGLGIGATATVFSAVYGVLLKPPPYAEPDRLMTVWERRPRLPMPDEVAAFSTDNFRQWRDANTVFEGMAMYGDRPVAYRGLAEAPGEPRPLSAEQVSPELFSVLGVGPERGRAFRPEEATPGRDGVVILGHAFWMREFGGDPEMLGRSLRLDDRSFEIVGIMPRGFGFPVPTTDLYLPYPEAPPADLQPGQVRLELVRVVARLGDGVTAEQAEAEAAALIARLSEEGEIQRMLNEGVTVRLASFRERATSRVRQPLFALFGVTLLVLLIACGNVANLLLTRAGHRERELAVRSALGAGRSRLLWRLFTESAFLAVASGALGVLLAFWGAALVRSLTVLGLPQLAAATVDGRVVAFTFLLSASAALVSGTLPALRAASRDPAAALDASGRGDAGPLGGPSSRGGRRWLFASMQLALTLPLLIAAGLLTRSFLALVAAPPGYEPRNTAVFEVQLAESRYPDAVAQAALLDRVREALAAVPGVSAVGIVDTLPLSGERAVVGFQRMGEEPVTDPNEVPRALLRRVSPGYFRAMGIPLLQGRAFEDNDRNQPGRFSVVNRTLVDRYLADPPVGLELRGLGEIVGVVGDVFEEGVDTPPEPILYPPPRRRPDAGAAGDHEHERGAAPRPGRPGAGGGGGAGPRAGPRTRAAQPADARGPHPGVGGPAPALRAAARRLRGGGGAARRLGGLRRGRVRGERPHPGARGPGGPRGGPWGHPAAGAAPGTADRRVRARPRPPARLVPDPLRRERAEPGAVRDHPARPVGVLPRARRAPRGGAGGDAAAGGGRRPAGCGGSAPGGASAGRRPVRLSRPG